MLFMVDAITGNIIYSVVHRRSRGPIQIVHSENWVIVSLACAYLLFDL